MSTHTPEGHVFEYTFTDADKEVLVDYPLEGSWFVQVLWNDVAWKYLKPLLYTLTNHPKVL